MPLTKSDSKEAQKKNMTELLVGVISEPRKKAIRTLAKRKGISFEKAREHQAKIIISHNI